MKILILYVFSEIIAFMFLSIFLFDIVIGKTWKNPKINEFIKNTTKSKITRYIVFTIFTLNFALAKINNIEKKFETESYKYEYTNDLMKRNYEIIKGEDEKLYAVMNKAESVPKVIVAEVKGYNEIILEKPENPFEPYKGKDIIIDFKNIKMIDNEYSFHSVHGFDKVTFKNKRFQKIKGKNEIYLFPYVYKIVEENDNDIVVDFKGRKKADYDEIVPWVNNEKIPSNYLEFFEGEKNLTVLFDK